MDLSTLDDASLLEMIANSFGNSGSEAILNSALSLLYDRYGRLVYSVALNLVGDVETSEEITQDVFVRACEGAVGYRVKIARVSTWLVSIARHRAIDELRRRGSRPVLDSNDWSEDGNFSLPNSSSEMESPEETVESTLQQQTVRQVLADLPEDQRLVLGLAYFKGMSHSQIASSIGEPIGTVKSRIRLAMQKLRDVLQEIGMIEIS